MKKRLRRSRGHWRFGKAVLVGAWCSVSVLFAGCGGQSPATPVASEGVAKTEAAVPSSPKSGARPALVRKKIDTSSRREHQKAVAAAAAKAG